MEKTNERAVVLTYVVGMPWPITSSHVAMNTLRVWKEVAEGCVWWTRVLALSSISCLVDSLQK